jgi:hypothetical protein
MQPVRKADNLTTILCRCQEICEPQLPGTLWATPGLYRDCFTSNSWNPLGHARPVSGLLYLKFLEPSGPHQAFIGAALPLPLPFTLDVSLFHQSCRLPRLIHPHCFVHADIW